MQATTYAAVSCSGHLFFLRLAVDKFVFFSQIKSNFRHYSHSIHLQNPAFSVGSDFSP